MGAGLWTAGSTLGSGAKVSILGAGVGWAVSTSAAGRRRIVVAGEAPEVLAARDRLAAGEGAGVGSARRRRITVLRPDLTRVSESVGVLSVPLFSSGLRRRVTVRRGDFEMRSRRSLLDAMPFLFDPPPILGRMLGLIIARR